MKDLFIVIGFTFKDLVKRKSFIISNIIIFIILIAGFNVPRILETIKGNNENFGKSKVTIFDNENTFEGTLDNIISPNANTEIEVSKEKLTVEEVKEKIKNKEIENAIYITPAEVAIDIKYIVESNSLMTEVPQDLLKVVETMYQNLQLSKLGITPDQMQFINSPFNVEVDQAEENGTSNVLPMMILSMVLFYAIYFFAYQISTSITIEKTSKIIETLVTSTSPRVIVLGKTIGIGLVGVCQTVVTVCVALVCAKLFLQPDAIEGLLSSLNITPTVGLITIAYYILGYSLFALLYALTGSTVAKPEDVQSANSPVAILAVIGFYLSYFTMMNPTSDLNKFAAMFPVSAPFCMPFRAIMGLATTEEILISLGILLVTILVVAKVSIKIYSSAILNYGRRLNISELFKIYKNKND